MIQNASYATNIDAPLVSTVQAISPVFSSTPSAEERAITIAILTPMDNSQFSSIAKLISQGIIAASHTQNQKAEVLLIQAPEETSMQEVLEKATLEGADIVIGPVQKSQVNALSALPHLPLPVLALNTPDALPNPTSSGLAFFSLGTDAEARFIAQQAITHYQKLYPNSERNNTNLALPSITTERTSSKQKILLIKRNNPWEERLMHNFRMRLEQHNIPYDELDITRMPLTQLKKITQADLTTEEKEQINQAYQRLRNRPDLDEKALQKAKLNIANRAKVLASDNPGPYSDILLALDAQMASFIRSSLPSTSRIWGTSSSNPGNPNTSSGASTLAYDLNLMIFADSPLLHHYDAQSFEVKFETTMPYSLSAKRLFAFGVDAFYAALHLAKNESHWDFQGEMGYISFNQSSTPVIQRTPSLFIIQDGNLLPISTRLATQTQKIPALKVPKKEPTIEIQEVLTAPVDFIVQSVQLPLNE